ncbi:hypothetical protein NN561_012404 [Cricetulus griseus]
MSVTRTSEGMCYPGILSDTAPCSTGVRIQFCDSCQWVLGSSPKRNLKKFGQSTRLPGCRLGASTSRCFWNAQCGHQAYLLPCQTHLKPHSTLPALACFAFPWEGRASSPEIHRLELGPSVANEKALFMSHRKSMRAPHARALTHICSSLSRVLQPSGISDKGKVVLAQQPVPAPQPGKGYWGNKIGKPHTVPCKVTGLCGSVLVRLIPVSYTHLDVYKRQEVATAIRGAIILAKLSLVPVRRGYWGNKIGKPHTVPCKVTGLCGSVLVRLIPVSYTHLDVYKRQEVATAIRGAIILAKLSLVPVRRGYWGNKIGKPHTVPCKVTGLCGSVLVRLIPVSYTHLDVYKRQEVATAIRGAIILAKLSLVPVRRGYWGNKIGKPHTVPCKVTGLCGSVLVRLIPVSYTHLDVYKRQEVATAIRGAIILAKLSLVPVRRGYWGNKIGKPHTVPCKVTGLCGSVLVRLIPVSYTHLDVYKRQEVATAIRGAIILAKLSLVPVRRGYWGNKIGKPHTVPCKVTGLCGSVLVRLIPVSYTHLDVYKRQEVATAIRGAIILAKLSLVPVRRGYWGNKIGKPHTVPCKVTGLCGSVLVRLIPVSYTHLDVYKRQEVATAIRGAIILAKLSLVPVRRGYWGNKIGKPHTVPCKVTGLCGSVLVRLIPVSYTHLDVYKRQEVATAIRGAIILAKLSLVPVRRGYWGNKIGKPHTVPCKVTGLCGSVLVRLIPVSYTHLDVYKRQEVATAIRGAIILAKLSLVPVRRGYWGNKIGKPHTVPCKVTGLCGSVLVRLIPVSYTHLDVYKRQEVATAIRGAIILAKLSLVPVRRGYWGNKIGKPHTVPCKVTGLCGSVLVRLIPVSYTHLDVYKRQEVATAIRGAIILAKLSLVPVRRGYWGNKIGKPHTVPCKVTGLCGSVLFLKSSSALPAMQQAQSHLYLVLGAGDGNCEGISSLPGPMYLRGSMEPTSSEAARPACSLSSLPIPSDTLQRPHLAELLLNS